MNNIDNNEAMRLLKMMTHSVLMKNAVKPEAGEEEKVFENNDQQLPEKIFKMTWMNWSGWPCSDDMFPKVIQTWIVDSDIIGYYAQFEDGYISDVAKMPVKQDWYDEFTALLKEDFVNQESCIDCDDGEGWEMTLYDGAGNVIHQTCGYIYGNEYLNKIVNTVKEAHEFSKLA